MKKRRQKEKFSGESNSSGFEVALDNEASGPERFTNFIEVRSRNYKFNAPARKILSKESGVARFIFLFLFSLIILIGSHLLFTEKLIVAAGKSDLPSLIRGFFICFSLVVISFTFAMAFRGTFAPSFKTARQWHACEHKLIHLFEKRLEINLKNLKKMRRSHWFCGNLENFYLASIIAFMLAMLYCVEVGFLMKRGWLLGLTLIGIVAAMLLVVLILTVYFFSTARPTEEQLEETLRVAKEFKEKYKELTNGSLK